MVRKSQRLVSNTHLRFTTSLQFRRSLNQRPHLSRTVSSLLLTPRRYQVSLILDQLKGLTDGYNAAMPKNVRHFILALAPT